MSSNSSNKHKALLSTIQKLTTKATQSTNSKNNLLQTLRSIPDTEESSIEANRIATTESEEYMIFRTDAEDNPEKLKKD